MLAPCICAPYGGSSRENRLVLAQFCHIGLQRVVFQSHFLQHDVWIGRSRSYLVGRLRIPVCCKSARIPDRRPPCPACSRLRAAGSIFHYSDICGNHYPLGGICSGGEKKETRKISKYNLGFTVYVFEFPGGDEVFPGLSGHAWDFSMSMLRSKT